MLFPLLIGVAAGVALERYYLSDEADKGCKEKEKVKEDVKAKAEEAKSSIMDFINSAKRRHPVLLPRRETAKKLMIMLAGAEDGTITATTETAIINIECICALRCLNDISLVL